MTGKRRAACACLIGIVLMLAACGGTSGAAARGTPSTPAPTASAATATATVPAATATATVPAGWRTYQGPHFTIAYPPTWTEETQAQGGSTASQPIIAYAFTAPTGSASGYVSVTESDNVNAATIQGTYCKSTSGDQTVTFAGVPMRFSQQTGGYRTRSWVLITNAGTVYQLYANDFLASASDYANVVAQNTAVLSTFQAQYTTPGC
jgi:hypothetical protein